MRIGIDYIATIGGGGNNIYSKNIIDAIIAMDKENQYYLYVYLHDFLRNRHGSIKQKNVHLRPAYLSSLGLPIPHKIISWFNGLILKLFIKFDRLDLFHFTNPIHFVRVIKNYVVTIHDLSSFHNKRWTKEGSQQFFSKTIPYILSASAKIIAVSAYTKQDIVNKFGTPNNKIEVIYEAADAKKYYPDIDPDYLKSKFNLPSYILYTGQLQPRKNVINLLRAYAELSQDIKATYSLVLVGKARDQEYSNMIQGEIKRLKLGQYVKILGRVDDDTLRKLYSSARCFIFPSFFEGFGLPLLESLQCGTPVIASNSTSLPEVVGDTGILVDPDNIYEITQAMKKMLIDEALYKDFRNKCLAQAGRFSWAKAARETLQCYEDANEMHKDESRITFLRNFRGTRELVMHARQYIKGRTLDLGAGSAKYKDIIQPSSSQYIALDIFPGPHIDIVADIIATGLSSESFDTVVCTQVFEHIPKPWKAVEEIQRILKIGGIAIVSAPFIQAYHADPNDYFRFTINGFKSLFDSGSFEIIECGGYSKMAGTLLDFIQMIWFSPYQKPRKGGRRIVSFLNRLGFWFDRFVSNKIVYGNSYVIVRKII